MSETDVSFDLDSARESIDYIDVTIGALLARRRELSHLIQAEKTAKGMPRTDIARENEIYSNYRAVLGKQGNIAATAILGICKG